MCSRTRATAHAPSLETVFRGAAAPLTVGIVSNQGLYSTDASRASSHDRTRAESGTRGVPSERTISAEKRIAALGPACVSQASRGDAARSGPLRGGFAAIRVRVGDGPRVKDGVHLPGDEAWLIAEKANRRDPLLPEQSTPATTSAESSRRERQSTLVLRTRHTSRLKEELGLGSLRRPLLARSAPSRRSHR